MSANLTPMTWSDYVRQTIGTDQQVDAARRADVDQTTISRWIRGGQAGRAENVVKLARAYKRPVLEALVVAGFISDAEARAKVTITRSQSPTDEELIQLLADRLRRKREDAATDEQNPAPSTRAGGSPAPLRRSDVRLAARAGTPAHAPDTTTGEESQDSGDFEPA